MAIEQASQIGSVSATAAENDDDAIPAAMLR
jgi:hypothetical protein